MSRKIWIPLAMTHSAWRETVSVEEMEQALPKGASLEPPQPLHLHDGTTDVKHQDWRRSQREQAVWWENSKILLAQNPGRPIAFFGLTAIPLALDLGYRFADTRRVDVFQHDRQRKFWRWPGRATDAAAPSIELTGLPTEINRRPGDVVLRISASYSIDSSDTEPIIGDRLATIDLRLGTICPDPFATPQELETFVQRFVEALGVVQRLLPGRRSLHLFVAGPVGLCLLLGSKLNKTIFSRVYAYQFISGAEPVYQRAFCLGLTRAELEMKLKVQFLASDSSRYLDLMEEHRHIKDRLTNDGLLRDRFEVHTDLALQMEEIQRLLDRTGAQVVHFAGHGKPGGLLEIQRASSKAPVELRVRAVVDLFKLLNRNHNIRLVVLNACHSLQLARALVEEGAVPVAIGMNKAIHDGPAIAFADGLYRALADGKSVEESFAWARNRIQLGGSLSSAEIPELCAAPGVDLSTYNILDP